MTRNAIASVIGTLAVVGAAAAPAHADDFSLGISIGGGGCAPVYYDPVYYAPAPVVVYREPYCGPRVVYSRPYYRPARVYYSRPAYYGHGYRSRAYSYCR